MKKIKWPFGLSIVIFTILLAVLPMMTGCNVNKSFLDIRVRSIQSGQDVLATASRLGPTSKEARFDWQTSNGTGIAGTHYRSAAGTVIIPVGERSAQFRISTLSNSGTEGQRNFNITLSGFSNAVALKETYLASVFYAPADLSEEKEVKFLATSQTVEEGVSSISVVVQLEGNDLNAGHLRIPTVPYTVSGSAVLGRDHLVASGRAEFDGQFAVIDVDLLDNYSVNESRQIVIDLLAPIGGRLVSGSSRHIVTIKDDDGPDQAKPTLLLSVPPGLGTTQDVVTDGGLAYVSSKEFGFSIYDLSVPSRPRRISDSPVSFWGDRVAKVGSLLLITGTPRGTGERLDRINQYSPNHDKNHLWIFDVSNPAQPTLLSNRRTTTVEPRLSVSSGGRFAFLISKTSKLLILNIQNPANPRLLNSLNNVTSVVTTENDGYLIVTGSNPDIRIFDFSRPIDLVEIWQKTFASVNYGFLELQSDTLILLGNTHARFYDLSDPHAPVFKGTGATGMTVDTALNGNTLATASDCKAKYFTFGGSPSSFTFTPIGEVSLEDCAIKVSLDVQNPGISMGVTREGTLASLSPTQSQPLFTDSPSQFVPLGIATNGASPATRAAIVGYEGERHLIKFIDLSNPSLPQVASELELPSGHETNGKYSVVMNQAGSVVYAKDNRDLFEIEIGDIARPTVQRSIQLPYWINKIVLSDSDDALYVSTSIRAYVVDLSQPDLPYTKYLSARTLSLFLWNSVIYHDFGIRYDISDPFSPTYMPRLPTCCHDFDDFNLRKRAVDLAVSDEMFSQFEIVMTPSYTDYFLELLGHESGSKLIHLESHSGNHSNSMALALEIYGIANIGNRTFIASHKHGLRMFTGSSVETVFEASLPAISAQPAPQTAVMAKGGFIYSASPNALLTVLDGR